MKITIEGKDYELEFILHSGTNVSIEHNGVVYMDDRPWKLNMYLAFDDNRWKIQHNLICPMTSYLVDQDIMDRKRKVGENIKGIWKRYIARNGDLLVEAQKSYLKRTMQSIETKILNLQVDISREQEVLQNLQSELEAL